MTQQQYKFQTTTSYTISSEGIGIILFHISISQEVVISGVFYISDYISNLLLLSQLKETGISYDDGNDYIILKRSNKEVFRAKQS